MLLSEQTVPEIELPALEIRALVRRLAVPALLISAVIVGALVGGARIHSVANAVRHGLDITPGWAVAGIAFECLSLAGYIGLLALVGGRATPRIGTREGAQITLAGVAATRLLPTLGAGGVALTLWTLRRAGLASRVAARTLLTFLSLLYCVFLSSIAVSGAVLVLGLDGGGPVELGAIAAAAAALVIAACAVLAFGPGVARSRLGASAQLLTEGIRDAYTFVRSGDLRLAGAVAYWAFDAAVLWAMLHAFGSPPALGVIMLAYFVGQVANTLPIPGSVSGGMTGVLIAFGVPAAPALTAVLAYRFIAVWIPTPVALAVLPGFRATIARWGREEASLAADPLEHAHSTIPEQAGDRLVLGKRSLVAGQYVAPLAARSLHRAAGCGVS